MNAILEHDYEPEPGLPEALPADETVLWQGSPDFGSLARSTFHVRKLAIYFAVLLALRLVLTSGSGGFAAALPGTLGLGALAALALSLLLVYAWLLARTSLFTITDRRIVVRAGIAVPMSMNLPFSRIDSVDLRLRGDGSGDLVLLAEPGSRPSWVLLWPFVRPFRLLRVRPVLRGIPEAAEAAAMLAQGLGRDASRVQSQSATRHGPERPEPAPREWRAYPTVPLGAAAALVVFSVVAVALTDYGAAKRDGRSDPVVAAAALYFDDRDDGAVVVTDAFDGAVLDVLPPASNGFLRSTLRSFVRTRRTIGADGRRPFELTRTAGGRLLLSDPATETEIDLFAFGKTNALAFGRFLDPERHGPGAMHQNDDESGAEVAAVALGNKE